MGWESRLARMNPTIHRAFRSESIGRYESSIDLTTTEVRFVELESSEGESETPGRVMRVEILPDALPVAPVTGDALWIGDVEWLVVEVTQTITTVFQFVLHRNGG